MPARQSVVEFDLHGQKSSVALLAVDKAFYGLHSDNRLTPKQVNTSPTFGSHVHSARQIQTKLLLPAHRPFLPCSHMISAAPTAEDQILDES